MTSKDGYKLVSELNPRNAMNRKRLAKVMLYYAKQIGITGTVGLKMRTLKEGDNPDENTSESGVLAFTEGDVIYMNTRGKRFNKSLNDYNNFKSTLFHEKRHKDKKEGFPETNTNSNTHAKVYFDQFKDASFLKTTQEFKEKIIASYASYVIGAFEDGQIGYDGLTNFTNDFNKLNIGYLLSTDVKMGSGEVTITIFSVKGKKTTEIGSVSKATVE